MSLLVRSEILGLFVNPLTADAKDSRDDTPICFNQFKCIYLKNQKLFGDIL